MTIHERAQFSMEGCLQIDIAIPEQIVSVYVGLQVQVGDRLMDESGARLSMTPRQLRVVVDRLVYALESPLNVLLTCMSHV